MADALQVPKVRTDEITRNISEVFNEKTGERHYTNEVRFSFANYGVLSEAFASGRAMDLAALPKRPRTSAIIVGSGPTLDEALPFLKDWPGEILCSTSQAVTLIGHGREPEHIVALDPDSNPGELACDTWEGRKSILHIHPGVMPDLIRWWQGPFALFRKLQPQTSFYGAEQNLGYGPLGPLREGRYWSNEHDPWIKAQVPMLASVIAAQICIAKHLGYKQFVLVGCDFSFPGQRERFTSRSWEGGQWVDYPSRPLEDYPKTGADPLLETEYDGLIATPMQIFYHHQVVIAWRLTETNIVNASDAGLLRMFPHVPLEEVLRRGNKGVKGYTLPRIRAVAEEHLARQNIYFIHVGTGIMPHEFKDPLHEVPRVLPQLKKQLESVGRGAELDVEANMKRLRGLFQKVTR